MSTIFERIRMGVAVAAAAVILVLSTVAAHDWSRFVPGSTDASDIESVRRGSAILERGRTPLIGMQPCDAIKSLLPDRFTVEVGNTPVKIWTPDDVIVCFRDSIDYGEALTAVGARRLTWERGLGGDRILVFAPSEARFLQVARMNGITFQPGDIQKPALLMGRLQAHPRTVKAGKQWVIAPGPDEEVLFGPYAALEPGAYKVRLAVQPETPISCADALRTLKMSISVSAEARTVPLVPVQTLKLKPGVGGNGRCLLSSELAFSITAPMKKVETPIWLRSSVLPLRVVDYDIEPVT